MEDDADDELDQESEDELEEEEEEGEDEEDDGNNNEDEEDDEEEEEEEQVNQKIAFHASPKNVFMSTLNNYRSNMNHETNRRQINSSGNFYHKSYQNIPIGHPNQSPFSFRNRGQQKVNTSRISSSSSSNSNSNLGSSEDGEVGMDIDTNTNKNISTLTQTSNQSTLLPFSKATAAQFLVELKKAQEQQTQKRQEENQVSIF